MEPTATLLGAGCRWASLVGAAEGEEGNSYQARNLCLTLASKFLLTFVLPLMLKYVRGTFQERRGGVSCNVGPFSLLVLHSVCQGTNRRKPGHLERYCFPFFYFHYPSKKNFLQVHTLADILYILFIGGP